MPPSLHDPSAASAAKGFPSLELLDASRPHAFSRPAKEINEGPDVSRFLTSKAYRDIGLFVMQLNRAMCPRKYVGEDGKDKFHTYPLGSNYETDPHASVRKIQQLLADVESLIDDAPPDTGPRRFGNVSFRKWSELLQDKAPALLRQYLDVQVLEHSATDSARNCSVMDEILAYFLGSFGSSQRLDYGTGHELSFLAFLGCLWKLGAFKDGQASGEMERQIVLGAFEPYLRVIRRLILTYTLEPAGSHGVWGLDDHSFLPYIFGSAQLTKAITDDDPMPLEGSLFRAPKPGMVVKPEYVEEERKRNMYFSAIGFINDVKKGPFWEHSPILFDVSGIRDGWGKINKGMIKMFNAEVLSKFPVVQHFPFGSLFSWDIDPDASAPKESVHMANHPIAAGAMPPGGGGPGVTGAPWAQGTSMPPPGSIPAMRAPWGPDHPVPGPPRP